MADITLSAIRKAYGPLEVVHGIDLAIADGEFLVLVGPSGCGKSTLLRMIAGLEDVTSGELRIGGTLVNALPPAERNIAMVFQDYALYPHMTVAENMGFGLKMRNGAATETEARVQDAAAILKIGALLDRRPGQLSGGQRQRVAMGRAIVRHPEAFLFDEPLSNLDAALRVEMRLEMARLHRRMKATTVYVTHDQVEAMTLADRIVVMNGGRVEQIGRPLELYLKPATLFVARFIGSPTMNVLTVPVQGRDGPSVTLDLPAGRRTLPSPGTVAADSVTLGIRAEDMETCDPSEAWFAGPLSVVERLGGQTFGYVDIGADRAISVELPRLSELQPGDAVAIRARDAANAHFFGPDGARIGP